MPRHPRLEKEDAQRQNRGVKKVGLPATIGPGNDGDVAFGVKVLSIKKAAHILNAHASLLYV